MNVFVYGSLMYDEIWDRLISGDFQREEAWISGYHRLAVRNEEYPGVVRGQGDVRGVIRFGLGAADIERLDLFEGDCYRRISENAKADSGKIIPVELYLVRKEYEHVLDDHQWDVTKFEESGMKKFVMDYPGFDR